MRKKKVMTTIVLTLAGGTPALALLLGYAMAVSR